ncbi:ribonuclease HII [Pseudidiomarina salinarum]|uniref:ribonuclease HII n=1 Tax=Pseudidiomarina salinarum TaxID=435908 RepID=UPI00054ECCA0|nr:ribonuclease HII [Pseudidiomarina salinarum]RUO70054.1 ribonuclease HII [Pseudidiomarina salinarum]
MICGTDEAGCGPLAGPVVAAAVILNPDRPIDGITDSKKLTVGHREELSALIKEHALYWAIAQCDPAEIDEINIQQAALLAMRRAVEALPVPPAMVLVDGNRMPKLTVPARTIIGGDCLEACIGAASILAKVERDRQMVEWHEHYPQYDFARHKAYATQAHLALLEQYGPSPIHRMSFSPVARAAERMMKIKAG